MNVRLHNVKQIIRTRSSYLVLALALGLVLWLAGLGGSWTLTPTWAQTETGCLLGQVQVGGAQTINGTIPLMCQPYTVYVEPCLPAFPGENVTAQTDEYGKFEVCGLPVGTYEVLVYGRNTLASKRPVSITVGTVPPGTIPLDFSLLPGDATNDNLVDIRDFSALSAAYGTSAGEDRFDARANFNCDSEVGAADYVLLDAYYRQAGQACE